MFRQVSNTWALLGSAVNGAAAGVLFGSALCLAPSGNRMVVGAPGEAVGFRRLFAVISAVASLSACVDMNCVSAMQEWTTPSAVMFRCLTTAHRIG